MSRQLVSEGCVGVPAAMALCRLRTGPRVVALALTLHRSFDPLLRSARLAGRRGPLGRTAPSGRPAVRGWGAFASTEVVTIGLMPAALVIERTSLRCSGVITVTTTPAAPARAVRPERCRKALCSAGGSTCTTSRTSSTWMPRAAMSVGDGTETLPSEKSARFRSLRSARDCRAARRPERRPDPVGAPTSWHRAWSRREQQ